MITNVKPMSVDQARALAMAYELHRLLGEIYDRPEHGPGNCHDLRGLLAALRAAQPRRQGLERR